MSIQNGASINDNGDVAFTGTFDAGNGQKSGLFVGNGISLTNISPAYSQNSLRQFSPYVQINNSGNVIATNRVTGTPLLSFARVWDSNNPESYQDAGRACSGGTGCNQSYLYNTILSAPTINNSGEFAFSSILYNNTYLVTNNNAMPLATGTTILRPIIADDGRVVVKHGQNPLDPILLYNNSLTSSEVIAGGSDWSELGRSPGISDDGQIIVFYGNLTESGAAKFSTTPGPGIFANIDTTNKGRVIQRIAGIAGNAHLDPGETFNDSNNNGIWDSGESDIGPFSSFSIDTRIAVNATQASQRAVTIVYIAFDAAGNKGIYSNRLNFFGTGAASFDAQKPGEFSVTRPTLVVERAEPLTGLVGTVQDLGIYDPLNKRDRGDVAFWAQMTTGQQAALRARYQQVIFIDFDPSANFGGANQPIQTKLLTENFPGVPWGWAPGNMNNILTAAGRGFNAGSMQNNIVGLVQDMFDNLVFAGSLGVNVSVIGRQGAIPPSNTKGSFIHVFVGDGPYGAKQCTHASNWRCGLNGVASTIDFFNQYVHFEDCEDKNKNGSCELGEIIIDYDKNGVRNIIDFGNKPALVFVDNIFRVSDYMLPSPPWGLFSDGSGNAVKLSQSSGPGVISQAEVEQAIATIITHEVGHTLGLFHLENSVAATLIMKQNPYVYGDELRHQQFFGNRPVALAHGLTGTENSGNRLALSIGSDDNNASLIRDNPDAAVLNYMIRSTYSMGRMAPGSPITVTKAFLGLASPVSDILPELIDLGSGDLATLLDRDIPVRAGDRVLLLASTNGSTIDIFSVDSTFTGNVGSIDLGSALLALTDTRIQGALFDSAGLPLASPQVDMYQLTTSGPVKIAGPGPALVTVPNVVNQTQADARAMITTAGLTLGMITTQNVDSIPAGYVISQTPPAGTQVVFGGTVNLVLSSGSEESVSGDLNGDSKVDCADMAIIKASFGKKLGQAGFDPKADGNDDGVIDVRDLSFVSRKLQPGTRCP